LSATIAFLTVLGKANRAQREQEAIEAWFFVAVPLVLRKLIIAIMMNPRNPAAGGA
jgi:hypothetical protein